MMIKFTRRAGVLMIAMQCAVLAACTQFPTEKSQVVDLRPQISFKLANPTSEISTARVLVNGLDAGVVSSYLEGHGALRILSGTNRIRVVSDSRIVLDEQVYLGDGVTRAFIIN